MRVERFRVDDLDRFENYAGQDDLVRLMPRDDVTTIVARGNHFSLYSGERIVACIGFVPVHEWRCTVWSLLQEGMPELFLGVHLIIRRLIREQPWPRIDAYVDPTSPTAERWVKLLGFECETSLKPYFLPDGRAASEWVFLKRVG